PLTGGSLQSRFDFAVTANGAVPVLPGAGRWRRRAFAPESLLVRDALPIIGGHQMGQVGVINVPAVQFLGGRPFEGIGGRLMNENSQEFSLAISQHRQYLGSACPSASAACTS